MSDPAELFVRWELGLCNAADEAELAVLLRDPGQRRRFARHIRVSLALSEKPVVAARPVRRRSVPMLWAAAASLLCAVGWWLGRSGSPPAVAQVVASAGAQAQAADGTWRTLSAGDRLCAAETLHGQAVVILADDSARLELDADARLRLPDGVALRLGLTAGRIQAEVGKRSAESPFSISSPHGEAIVVGTGFSFAADVASSRLAVTSGAVRLRATDGSEVLVAAGQAGLGQMAWLARRRRASLPSCRCRLAAGYCGGPGPRWHGMASSTVSRMAGPCARSRSRMTAGLSRWYVRRSIRSAGG